MYAYLYVGEVVNVESLSQDSRTGSLIINDNITAAISLPQSIVNLTNDDSVSLSFTLYIQAALFPVRQSTSMSGGERTSIPVVASSVVSASIVGIPDGTLLLDPIVVTLSLNSLQSGSAQVGGIITQIYY